LRLILAFVFFVCSDLSRIPGSESIDYELTSQRHIGGGSSGISIKAQRCYFSSSEGRKLFVVTFRTFTKDKPRVTSSLPSSYNNMFTGQQNSLVTPRNSHQSIAFITLLISHTKGRGEKILSSNKVIVTIHACNRKFLSRCCCCSSCSLLFFCHCYFYFEGNKRRLFSAANKRTGTRSGNFSSSTLLEVRGELSLPCLFSL
jgi:hypothetical protein